MDLKEKKRIDVLDSIQDSVQPVTISKSVFKFEPDPTQSALGGGKYYLIVIAINVYEDNRIGRLSNAERDAQKIRDILISAYGFKLYKELFGEAAKQKDIVDLLRLLADPKSTTITKEDNLVIYFSGHGDIDGVLDDGYWWTYSDNLDRPQDCIKNSVIKQYLHAIPAKNILLISDSCFSGSFFKSDFVFSEEHTRPDFFGSRIALTSGANKPVSDGTVGEHSPFAKALLKVLSDNPFYELMVSTLHKKLLPEISIAVTEMKVNNQISLLGPLEGIKHASGGQFVFQLTKPKVDPGQLKSALFGLNYSDQQITFERNPLSVFNLFLVKGTAKCGHVLLFNRLRRVIRDAYTKAEIFPISLSEKEFNETSQTRKNNWETADIWQALGLSMGFKKESKPEKVVDEVIRKLNAERHVFFLLNRDSRQPDLPKPVFQSFWEEWQQQMVIWKNKNGMTGAFDKIRASRKRLFIFVLDKTRLPGEAQDAEQDWTFNITDPDTFALLLPPIPLLGFDELDRWYLKNCPEDENMPKAVDGDVFYNMGSKLDKILPRNENLPIQEVVSKICLECALSNLEGELFQISQKS